MYLLYVRVRYKASLPVVQREQQPGIQKFIRMRESRRLFQNDFHFLHASGTIDQIGRKS